MQEPKLLRRVDPQTPITDKNFHYTPSHQTDIRQTFMRISQQALVQRAEEAFESAKKREWVGLNWDDLPEIYVGDTAFMHGAKWAEGKLKEKNT